VRRTTRDCTARWPPTAGGAARAAARPHRRGTAGQGEGRGRSSRGAAARQLSGPTNSMSRCSFSPARSLPSPPALRPSLLSPSLPPAAAPLEPGKRAGGARPPVAQGSPLAAGGCRPVGRLVSIRQAALQRGRAPTQHCQRARPRRPHGAAAPAGGPDASHSSRVQDAWGPMRRLPYGALRGRARQNRRVPAAATRLSEQGSAPGGGLDCRPWGTRCWHQRERG